MTPAEYVCAARNVLAMPGLSDRAMAEILQGFVLDADDGAGVVARPARGRAESVPRAGKTSTERSRDRRARLRATGNATDGPLHSVASAVAPVASKSPENGGMAPALRARSLEDLSLLQGSGSENDQREEPGEREDAREGNGNATDATPVAVASAVASDPVAESVASAPVASAATQPLTLFPDEPSTPSTRARLVQAVYDAYIDGRAGAGLRGEGPSLDGNRKYIERALKNHSADYCVAAVRGIWLKEWNIRQKQYGIELALRPGKIEGYADVGFAGVFVPENGKAPMVQPATDSAWTPNFMTDDEPVQADAVLGRKRPANRDPSRQGGMQDLLDYEKRKREAEALQADEEPFDESQLPDIFGSTNHVAGAPSADQPMPSEVP